MAKTNIEWTEETWNPVTGCTPVSAGCEHCYAKRMATRLAGRYGYPQEQPFAVTLHPDRLTEPLRWRKPRTVFVCSMGDLFHEQVPDYYIDRVLEVMAAREQHTFLVLTKRPARMLAYLAAIPRMSVSLREAIALEFSSPDPWHEWPLPNVWLGVSVEDQQTADERIPLLLKCPAAVRFVSCEPLLGPVDLSLWLYRKHPPSGDLPSCHENLFWLDWIIVGGETGPGARPMHPQWARSIRDQCAAAGVPFFHKHHGEYICIPRDEITAEQQAEHERCRCHLIDSTGRRINAQIAGMAANHPDVHYAIRVGRQRAGRLLDGKLHDAMPEAR